MGGGKGGTSTSTVSIPPEVLARYNAVNARAEEVAQTPFQPYGGEFVAPMNTVQQQGVGQTQQYAQAAQPYYGTAAGMTTGAAQAAQPYYSAATGITGAALAGEQPGYQQALGMTTGAAGAAQPLYGAAQMQTLAAAQPLSAQQIARYQSPYTQAVVDPTLQALRQQQGIDLGRQQAQQIQTGAYGGDRAGLSRAMLQGQQELAQAQAIAPLYQQAYQNALQTAQQQQQMGLSGAQQLGSLAGQQLQGQLTAGQQLGTLTGQQYANALSAAQQLAGIGGQQLTGQLSAAQQLAGIGTGAQQAGLQGAQAVIGAGTLGQQTQQALDTAQYQQFLQQRGYPFQTAQFLANIAEGTGALSGSTTTTTQPTSFFSDERLKTDIKKIATAKNGLPIYSFKYKDDPKTTHIGFIAQDVEKKHPEAVGLSGGYKTVDYGKALREARAMGGGLMPSSMGGGVWPANDRQDFAAGGGPMSLQDILAQQYAFQSGQDPSASPSLPYAGMAQKGLGIPMQKSPAARAGLMKASPPPQQPSGLQSAMQNIASAGKTAETLSGGYDWAKKGLTGTPAVTDPKTGQVTQKATSGALGYGGEWGKSDTNATKTDAGSPPPADPQKKAEVDIFPKDDTAFVAYGGGIKPRIHASSGSYIDPYKPASSESMIPEDVMEDSESTKDKAEGQAIKPDGSRGGGGGGGGLGSALSTASGLYGAAKGVGSFLSWLPTLFVKDGGRIRYYSGGLIPREYHAGPNDSNNQSNIVGASDQTQTDQPQPSIAKRVYDAAINSGADPKTALVLTSSAASESNFQHDIEHDRDPNTGAYTGYGLFGHRGDRLANMRQFSGTDTPSLEQQVAFATNELKNPYYQNMIANARSPEDLTKVQMHFERPRGYTPDSPESGHNYAGRMANTNALLPLTSGMDVNWPAVQKFAQQYPFQKQVEGGLGAAKDLTSSLVPLTYEGKERKGGWGDFLTSRDFILPLMAGLGTMASSPSRYLGAAILQGLGGAAQAYQGVQNQQLARDKSIAEQMATTSGLPSVVGGIEGGKPKFGAKYDYMFGPTLRPDRGDGTTQATQAGGLAPITAIRAPEAPVIQPVTGPSGGYSYTVNPTQTANNRLMYAIAPDSNNVPQNASKQQIRALIDLSPDLQARETNDVKAGDARSNFDTAGQRIALNNLHQAFEGIPNSGFFSKGPGFDERQTLLNLADYWNRVAPGVFGDVDISSLKNSQILDKLRTIDVKRYTPPGGSNAGFIQEEMARALPSGHMTEGAGVNVMASMMLANAREEDFKRYYTKYRGQHNTALLAQENFDNDMGQYYNNIKPKLIEALTPRGDISQPSPAEYLRKHPETAAQFEKHYNAPGLARIILGG